MNKTNDYPPDYIGGFQIEVDPPHIIKVRPGKLMMGYPQRLFETHKAKMLDMSPHGIYGLDKGLDVGKLEEFTTYYIYAYGNFDEPNELKIIASKNKFFPWASTPEKAYDASRLIGIIMSNQFATFDKQKIFSPLFEYPESQ